MCIGRQISTFDFVVGSFPNDGLRRHNRHFINSTAWISILSGRRWRNGCIMLHVRLLRNSNWKKEKKEGRRIKKKTITHNRKDNYRNRHECVYGEWLVFTYRIMFWWCTDSMTDISRDSIFFAFAVNLVLSNILIATRSAKITTTNGDTFLVRNNGKTCIVLFYLCKPLL